jgi:mono/diheme cytochrome c family protein
MHSLFRKMGGTLSMRTIRFVTITSVALCLLIAAQASHAAAPDKPTFTRDVAPILYSKCVVCHSPNMGAPMSLRTYEEVRPWAKSILKNVEGKVMPPWHASPEYGHFENDRSLSDAEIATITTWIRQGTRRGSKSDLPPAPALHESGWKLGDPDLVLEFKEVSLRGGGHDRFYNLSVDTDLPEDRWLSAVEIMPSNKLVAHHVILYQQAGGGRSANGWLGAWAAGTDPMQFPDGTGRVLKKGARLVADMHYHPAETPQRDTLRVGLHFGEEGSIEKELINLWIMNQDIDLPPGAKNVEVTSTYTFGQDSHVLGLFPHMHYRGRDFTYTATYPDGSNEILLEVDDYNFAWQTNYMLSEPKAMPAGTRIDCVAHYDNSTDNPYNPDPTAHVTNGSESFDEMMIGFVDYVVDEGVSPQNADDIILSLLSEMKTEHETGVFRTSVMGQYFGALHLVPGDTAAVWTLAMMGDVRQAQLSDIAWNGDAFTATGHIQDFGTFAMTGTIDREKDRIRGKIDVGKEVYSFGGTRPR